MPRRERVGWAAALLLLAFATVGGGGAMAARLLTGKQIKNGSIGLADLSKKVRKQLKRSGRPGPKGSDGVPGTNGLRGPEGAKGASGDGSPTTSGNVSLAAAGGGGTTVSLLTVGPIAYTANCKDNGGGSVTLNVRMQTTEAGAIATSRNGFTDLTGAPQVFWTASGTGNFLFSERQNVITPAQAGHRADVVFGINKVGNDCFVRIDASTS